jgi:5-methylcytosine-specific restriction enzyme A
MPRPQDRQFYNSAAWQRLRIMQLQREPLCRMCATRGLNMAMAYVVDHIVPRSRGGNPLALDNLQSLCAPCHSAKTARGLEAGAVRSTKPRRGCDASGNPLDAAHEWSNNRKISGS